MLIIEVVILAIVQGIAEFLPISSSGHIVVLATLFEQFGESLGDPLTLNIILHMGTLAAIVVVYWRRIIALLTRDRRVIGLIFVGSIPAAFAGLVIKEYFNDALESALVAGFMFPITGVLLLWSARRKQGEMTCRELTYRKAIIIGLFQCLAILPGISRSGTTIITGLCCGLRRDEAATFSFLLAIPIIGGAGLLETVDLLRETPESINYGLLAIGSIVSFGVGIFSLLWLLKWLEQGRLHLFAYWVLALGPIVILWQLFAGN